MTNTMGKVLRYNLDGSIPPENPFYNTLTGSLRAIYASGLRSPFSMGINQVTGQIFFNDAGAGGWEEINNLVPGGNYGWPFREGTNGVDPMSVTTILPLYQYPHDDYQPEFGCAITAGTFYHPLNTGFPGEYVGKYFFADYCEGWFGVLDPADNSVTRFADGDGSLNVVDMKVNPDGELYFLKYREGQVYKITYTGTEMAPVIVSQPQDVLAPVGSDATFSFSTIGSFPLTYQWQRNGANIPGANAPSYTLNNVQLGDAGALFQAMVQNALGTDSSAVAILDVTDNRRLGHFLLRQWHGPRRRASPGERDVLAHRFPS
jgi:hypothetical protein